MDKLGLNKGEVNTILNEIIPPNHYRCSSCKQIFECGWTDEEAKAEKEDNFPDMLIEDMGLVCDGCYKRIMEV